MAKVKLTRNVVRDVNIYYCGVFSSQFYQHTMKGVCNGKKFIAVLNWRHSRAQGHWTVADGRTTYLDERKGGFSKAERLAIGKACTAVDREAGAHSHLVAKYKKVRIDL